MAWRRFHCANWQTGLVSRRRPFMHTSAIKTRFWRRHATAHAARLGPARIGNWDRIDRKLSGRVDEMLILGRAMTDAEVGALFEAGNPYL